MKLPRLVLPIAALFILSVLVLFVWRVRAGSSLGLKSAVASAVYGAKSMIFSIRDSAKVQGYNQGQFTNVIFLHHSVGHNLIEQGGLRGQLTAAGFSFSDHGYNSEGLVGPDGAAAAYGYNVPGDNTDPDGLAQIFAQPAYPLPLNTFSALLQYEVIAVKSCFPNSNIESEERFVQFQEYYLSIRDRADQYPDKLFIILTSPPLNPAETNAQAAVRARAMARWLASNEFLGGHPNLFTFDLFGHLAENNPAAADANMLSKAYRAGTDSHPNQAANEKIAPLFVDYVTQAVQQYRTIHAATLR